MINGSVVTVPCASSCVMLVENNTEVQFALSTTADYAKGVKVNGTNTVNSTLSTPGASTYTRSLITTIYQNIVLDVVSDDGSTIVPDSVLLTLNNGTISNLTSTSIRWIDSGNNSITFDQIKKYNTNVYNATIPAGQNVTSDDQHFLLRTQIFLRTISFKSLDGTDVAPKNYTLTMPNSTQVQLFTFSILVTNGTSTLDAAHWPLTAFAIGVSNDSPTFNGETGDPSLTLNGITRYSLPDQWSGWVAWNRTSTHSIFVQTSTHLRVSFTGTGPINIILSTNANATDVQHSGSSISWEFISGHILVKREITASPGTFDFFFLFSGSPPPPPPLEPWQIENKETSHAIALSGNKTAVNVKIWTSATTWELKNFVDAQFLHDIQCGGQSGSCTSRYTTSELLSIAFGFEISREDVISGSFKWSVFQSLGE